MNNSSSRRTKTKIIFLFVYAVIAVILLYKHLHNMAIAADEVDTMLINALMEGTFLSMSIILLIDLIWD